MSQRNTEILIKKGCLQAEKLKGFEFCEDCVYGKTHRVGFGSAKHVTREKLEYIHSDLWGAPSVPNSLGNCQYFITFIDDYTRKVWIYFLKKKDEAFKTFVEWKKMVENQSNKKVKKLRTDNGLEFCNQEFDGFCKLEGVVRHRTCAYTPQQNGVAERMNRTIMDKVRSMLSESGLSKRFWAEAASTAVYVINRSPASAIEFEIPEKAWTGALPDLSNLRSFGCITYVHSDQGKLNPRAKKGVFVGYPTGVKGYRVWVLEDKKVVISKDVVFNEGVMFKDSEQSDKEEGEETSEKEIEISVINTPVKTGTAVTETAETAQGGAVDQRNGEEDLSSLGQRHDHDSETDSEDEYMPPSLEDYQLARDRERRTTKPPKRFDELGDSGFAYNLTEDGGFLEPTSYTEAMQDADYVFWKEAADEEIQSLDKNHTWDLVDRPEKQKVIGCKWVFKRKLGIPGVEQPRFKARLVAKGYSQREGIDFQEIFSPVVKHVSIRLMLSAVSHFDLELEQLDVKTAFLHGSLDEIIYMSQPEGYEDKGSPEKVCLLKKSLYGLRQSPRQWNQRFDQFMKSTGYSRSLRDSCVYFKKTDEEEMTFLLLYVDDMLIISKNKETVKKLKERLSSEFEMKDLGPARKILGMEITRNREENLLELSQKSYLQKVLNTFRMEECKPVKTPLAPHMKFKAATEIEADEQAEKMKSVPYANAVGSIMYSMIGSRPDLAYPVGVISRFMSKPLMDHWQGVKWVLRYIKGSVDSRLQYKKESDFVVTGYCDSDYAADLDRRRSITGYTFTVGGNIVSWRSCLQPVVALSTTEAEYIALTEATKEAVWLKELMNELGFTQGPVDIHCDSQSAIALAKNAVHHERTKHIQTKFHYIRDAIADEEVKVLKISTVHNPADILTKVLPINKFLSALKKLRVKSA